MRHHIPEERRPQDEEKLGEDKGGGVNITIFISSLELYLSETMHMQYDFDKTEGSPGQ
jgi:hypothetical protein